MSIIHPITMTNVIEITMNYWQKEKINCARSTSAGILKFNNDQSYNIFKNALIPFGGGILGSGSSCGAVVGTYVALSKLLADKGCREEDINKRIDTLNSKFIEKYGSIECRSILTEFSQLDGTIDYNHPNRKPKCTQIVSDIVIQAQKIIDNTNINKKHK